MGKNDDGAIRKVSSLDSISSVASTSSQRLSTGNRDHEFASTAVVTTSYGRNLSDICAIVIHCPKHDKFAMAPLNGNKGLWLPYVNLRQSEGLYATIVNKLRQLLKVRIGVKSSTVFTPPEIMHIFRIQLPEVLTYLTRVVFMTNLQSVACSAPSMSNSGALKKSPSAEGAAKKSSGSHEHSPIRHSNSSLGSFKCFCEQKDDSMNGLCWLKHETIVSEEESLDIWGPEPAIFTSAFATNTVEKGAYSEYTLREAIKYQPRDQPRTYQEEMLVSCRFERNDVLRLYSDYVQHCYPSQNMNYNSFHDYMVKLGYEPAGASISPSNARFSPNQLSNQANRGMNVHDMHSLYRAFKLNKSNPYVTFHELLLGLAAMDRATAHGSHVGELRCSYIFRYYDTNEDGKLSSNELRLMALDRLRVASIKQIQQSIKVEEQKNQVQSTKSAGQNNSSSSGNNGKSTSKSNSTGTAASNTLTVAALIANSSKIDPEAINKELANIYKMLNLKMGDSIGEMDFMLAVGNMKLRGTSNLFRSQISVLPVKQLYDVIAERHALTDIEGNLVGTELQKKGTCPRCKDKRYSLALHTVKLTHDAQIVEPTEVRFDELPPRISRSSRVQSRARFSSDSTPNRLIDMITGYWNSLVASQQASSGINSVRLSAGLTNAVPLGKTSWERMDRTSLADCIKEVCSQAEDIFKREARVVAVTSPCTVLGDIHGNLMDLRTYERILWPNAPTCVSGSFLFLGDYVDRGDFGLECISYLLSMKVLAPKTFFLLRGNHELRSIQQAFTFFREVCDKFRNQQLGMSVWETMNKTFDHMPVAATIDDQIFCAHGGIPTSALRLDELHLMPSPMPDPENQCAAAWEILWNDPVSNTEYAEYADLLRKQPGGQQAVTNMQGYLPNTKRGTAFFFSEEAVKKFLHLNNLTHIIRAHECVPPGYALHCNGRVLTIFSSSHYCGTTNDAACVLVEREKIRIIRLDTD